MATVTLHVGTSTPNWNIGDLNGVTPLTESDDYFEADFSAFGNPEDILELFGSGFKYGGDDLPGKGTIEKLQQTDSGVLQWEIEDVSLSASKLDAWVESGDSLTAFATIFGGDDTFIGSNADDVISAHGGDDTILGGKGKDFLSGREGNDALDGEAGNDTLVGGLGHDTLTGANGADTFLFRGVGESPGSAGKRDTITDFDEAAGDLISLLVIDADTTMGGNQAFTFIGAAAFSGTAGELRFNNGVVRGDVDGDGSADLAIELAGVVGAAADDFIL